MELTLNEQEKTMKKTSAADDMEVVCPRCGRRSCIRIKRGVVVKALFSWLPLKHYHCQNCIRNFYKV